MNYGKSKTYTIYTDISSNYKITNRAIYLRKWHGPIFNGKYQSIMCYDKETLYKLFCYCRDAKVTIYGKRQTGFNQYEYRPLTDEEIEETLEKLYSELKHFRVTFDSPTPIEEITKYNKGIKPRYGRGTGKGEAHCGNCGSCVCAVINNNGIVVGWAETTCKCGDDVDYTDAEQYL